MRFVPLQAVKLIDPVWSKTISQVRKVLLPYQWDVLNDRIPNAEKSHCIENFRIAAGLSAGTHYGMVFQDTDLYKWIEAAAYCLTTDRQEQLEKLCDEAAELIVAAQQPDGYINTYYTVAAPGKRWTNMMEGHELYCAGHFIEAAVAYAQATGKDKLLKAACRFADAIDTVFGPGKRRGYPGHPEIELALVRLFGATGEKRYLSLASYFINERGVGENLFEKERQAPGRTYIFPEMKDFDPTYFQAHAPVREQKEAMGHAVRAMYLYCAMADLAALEKDASLKKACESLYENVITRQMYVTGGIGSSGNGERFTTDFDLPSSSGYSETCASIGLMLLSSRMWCLNHNALYYHVWERVLYNAVLSGMGQDGRHFFYVNPLEVIPDVVHKNPSLSHVKTTRPEWFGVACCPPNLARMLTSLAGYIYAMDETRLYILSHIGSSFEYGDLKVSLVSGEENFILTVAGESRDICLRIPENHVFKSEWYTAEGEGYSVFTHNGGVQRYCYSLVPCVRLLRSHPRTAALAGKVCVQRGQTVYCVEEADNAAPLSALRLPSDAAFQEERPHWLPQGAPLLKTRGYRIKEEPWDGILYDEKPYQYEPCDIHLIPYSQWGNRGEGEMSVWLTEAPSL